MSRPPGHGGTGAPVTAWAHPAAGLHAAGLGPEAMTGTAAQLLPRKAVTVVRAGPGPGARSRPGTAARCRELARRRPGGWRAAAVCGMLMRPAAGSRASGLVAGAGGG